MSIFIQIALIYDKHQNPFPFSFGMIKEKRQIKLAKKKIKELKKELKALKDSHHLLLDHKKLKLMAMIDELDFSIEDFKKSK